MNYKFKTPKYKFKAPKYKFKASTISSNNIKYKFTNTQLSPTLHI